MGRKRLFYILFFIALIVLFFGALGLAIPGFFSQRIPPISRVEPFAFTTQEGKIFTDRDVLGKVNAVNFFFTTCKTVCPRMNNNLEGVYQKFKNEPGFMVLSYTCDPSVDSVSLLKHYADSLGADPKKWVF